MIVASVHVSGVNARTTECSRITAGLVGAKIEIDYQDSVWGPLTKTVVFWGAAVKDVVTNDNVVTIPAEVVATYGKRLRVGVYGVDGSGALVIPTIWADLGEIIAAADPSGDETTDPSSPVWAQVAALAEASARAAAGSANDAAASAAQAEAAAGSVGGAVEAAGVILRDTQAAARQAGTYVEEAAASARDAAAQAESADYSAQDAAQAAMVASNAATAAGDAAASVHTDAAAAARSAESAAEAASDAVRSAEAAASGVAGAQNAAAAAQGHAASAASSARSAEAAAASVPQSIEEALAEAKASGEFNGPKGDSYELTDDDKAEIVEQVTKPVESSAAAAALSAQNSAASANASQIHSSHAAEYRADANAAASRAADAAAAAQTQQQQAAASAAAAAASAAEAKQAADSAAIVPKPTAAVAGKALIVNTAGTGYEFGNAPGGGSAFVVTITDNGGSYTADKTNTEIYEAYTANRPIYAKLGMYEMLFIAAPILISDSEANFSLVVGTTNIVVSIYGENTVEVVVGEVGGGSDFVVNISSDNVADTTAAEIHEAFIQNRRIYALYGNMYVLSLVSSSGTSAAFSMVVNNIGLYAVVDSNGNVTVQSFNYVDIDGVDSRIGFHGVPQIYAGSKVGQTVQISAVDGEGRPLSWKSVDFPDDDHINRLIDAKAIPNPETAAVGQTLRVSAVSANGKPTAWEAVDFPSGGGGEALSEEWTEEVLLSGVLATTDTTGMFDTGLTWADLKKYDVIQFSYDGTISGDVFIGFCKESNSSQWGFIPQFFRASLQAVGFVRLYLLGGGTVADVRVATAKATNMKISEIASVDTRTFTAMSHSSNLVKIKGAVHYNGNYGALTDDSHFKIYFTNAPTADLTWYLIGGNY